MANVLISKAPGVESRRIGACQEQFNTVLYYRLEKEIHPFRHSCAHCIYTENIFWHIIDAWFVFESVFPNISQKNVEGFWREGN